MVRETRRRARASLRASPLRLVGETPLQRPPSLLALVALLAATSVFFSLSVPSVCLPSLVALVSLLVRLAVHVY